MGFLKSFFESKSGKRALWTLLNSAMALIVAGVTFAASNSIEWAIVVLPFAQAFSQFFTKYLNSKE